MSSIFSYIGRSLWFVGSGYLLYNGSRLTGNPQASTTLRFILFEDDAYNNGTIYTAGLTSPAVATVAQSATAGKLNGTYSVRLTAIRSNTSHESSASIQSAVVTCTNKKIDITFPAAVGNGHDKWGVYVTKADFGSKGPHFSLPISLTGMSPAGFVTEAAVAAAGSRTLSFDWFDGDLVGSSIAPIDHGVPPVGTHAFPLEGCIAVAGCYAGPTGVTVDRPGNMIAVSKAGFPEAFPVDVDHLLALPEAPTCVLTRAAGGFVYVAGANSLSVVRYTGSASKAPMALSVLWPDTGFANQNNACLADGILYGYSAVKGLVRIDNDGNPDYKFSAAIAKQFEGVAATDVHVGYDPSSNHVVYGYNVSGDDPRLMCFNKAWGVWSAPIKFEELVSAPTANSSIKSMYTDNGQLYIVLDTGGDDYVIYKFNSGSGSNWKLRSAWRDGGFPEKNKTLTRVLTATGNNSSNPSTVKVYTNLSETVKDSEVYTSAGSPEHLRVKRTDLRNAKTYSVELSGTDDDSVGLEAVVEGVASEINT
jgi:hypothetical protein